METHHFWAFLVIALMAGAAIGFGMNNAPVTGYFTWPWQKAPAVATPIAPTMNVTGCGAYTCVPQENLDHTIRILGCYVQCESNENVALCVNGCLEQEDARTFANIRDCFGYANDPRLMNSCITSCAMTGSYTEPYR